MSKVFVIDTNTLISAALLEGSVPANALDKAIETGRLATSKNTTEEFIEVLFRKKFDKYFPNNEERWRLVRKVETVSLFFRPEISITDCRDAKDNKFLELAVAANAACIVTGDKDLLVLHPFRDIPILSAVDFLNHF